MNFFKVLDNNVCTISGNGFIRVQGPIVVSSSQQSYSQQLYSFSNSVESSAFDFEGFSGTSLSGTSFVFTNSNTFSVGSTNYTGVTLNGNKIEFTSEVYIELPDDISNSTTKFTKKDGSKEYILYENINNGKYGIVVIFDCTNNTVEVKQLYHEQKLGSDIDGENNSDESGTSVSLSSDGTIVAIGAYGYDAGNSTTDNRGHVRVYQWRQYTEDDDDNNTYHYTSYTQDSSQTKSLIITEDTSTEPVVGNYYWTQLGEDIDGEANYDQSGYSVSLSSDGSIVAIGAISNNGNGTLSGHVRVYEYKGTTWSQLGEDIDGELGGDQSGYSVSLSSDGTIVAMGAKFNNGNGDNSGHARVYEYDASKLTNVTNQNDSDFGPIGWRRLGQDIDGELSGDQSGNSVSVSSDGSIVAIGAISNDAGNNDDTKHGHVQVYEYKGTTWSQLGEDIDGEASNDYSGYSVSLSSDGTIVAIGAYGNDGASGTDSGHVRVYQRDTSNMTNAPIGWTQLGEDIDGEASVDKSGWSVSLSSDGTIVAIGAIYNDAGNSTDTKHGHVRIYKYNESSNTWVKIYKDIDGEASADQSGFSVSLSSGGNVVAIGAPNHNSGKGTTRIYRLPSNPIADINSTTISSSNYITLEKKPYSITSITETSHVSIETYEGLISSLGENDGFTGNTGINISDFYLDDISYTGINITGSHIQFDGSDVYFDIGNGVTAGTEKIIENTTSTNSKLQILYDIPDSHYMVAKLDCLHNTANVVRYNKALQVGEDIDGEAKIDFSGNSVSLSEDGSIVAIGAYLNDGNGSNSGHVRVYEWRKYTNDDKSNNTYHHTSREQGTTNTKSLIITSTTPVVGNYYWTQLGKDIDYPGTQENVNFGISVSLSSDGHTVAIGGHKFDDWKRNDRGIVQVYQRDTSETSGWKKLGNSIIGRYDEYTKFGVSVSLSSYGKTVAIGAHRDDGNEKTNNGTVGVFTYTENTWTRLGNWIHGEANNDESGYSVSLSSDGTIVAIGARYNDGNGSNSGHVRVYQRDTSVTSGWTRLGEDIDGEAIGDNSGWSVSLSSDGTNGIIVAIGARYNDGGSGTTNLNNSGHVRVYKYNETSWTQLGQDIDGEANDDESGYSVSLSSDGTIVAIGARYNDSDSTTDTKHGHVRIYKYNESSNTWVKMYLDIDGEASDDESGYSVSLSSDGTIVAIGARYNDAGNSENTDNRGHVKVYQLIPDIWSQQGQDIDGEANGDESGYSVSLSSDGTIVAIGAMYYNSVNGSGSGRVCVYEYNGTTWSKLGNDIDGEANGDHSGQSVSLSSDGTIVAIGAIENNGVNGSNSGHVRVYQRDTSVTSGWTRLGQDIDGENKDDFSGRSVSLSSDGSIVAIGAHGNGDSSTTNPVNSGHVRVYQRDITNMTIAPIGWKKLGEDIDGEASGNRSGWSVSLSSDGSIVAVGAHLNNGVIDSISGHVRVYQWREYTNDDKSNNTYHHTSREQGTENTKSLIITGSTSTEPDVGTYYWTQLGQDIDGEASGDYSGQCVSLSSDGTIVAIGAIYNDAGNNTTDNRGHVRVYEYHASKLTNVTNQNDSDFGPIGWRRLGQDIDGEASSDFSGYSVSLSSDGTIVAIGGSGSKKSKIYEYKNNTWVRTKEFDGYNVSLSSDGKTIACGDPSNSNNTGKVLIYGRVIQTLNVKYRTGKDIVEEEVSLSQVGGYNYLIDN